MKPSRLFFSALVLAWLAALGACAPIEFEEYPDGTPGKSGSDGASANAGDRLTADYENALPVESQLILGTLLLEGTDNAVTAEQAAVLLPLWEEWHDLGRNSAASSEDKGALLEKIQSAMTPEQIQAIAAMQLTQEDMFAYMQENGVGYPPRSTGTPDPQNPDGGGTPPPGADSTPPGPDGGGPNPGFDTTSLSPEEIATLQSVYQYAGGNRGPDWQLLHTLLDLLEAKQQA